MNADPVVYCRQNFVRQSGAVIPATDHGTLFGMGVFETFRTFGGTPFLLDRHIARLRRGLAAFRIGGEESLLIGNGMGTGALPKVIGELLVRNGWNDAVFRYTVSAGAAGAGPPREPYTRPTEIVFVKPLPPEPPKEGLVIRVLETPRLPGEFYPRGKTAGYANSLAGLAELRAAGAGEEEGLLLTASGHLSEAVFSNLFFVSNGRLHTPALETQALPGIMRALVLELASDGGIPVEEGLYDLEDLLRAEAVFLTNAVRGIMPVARVNKPSGHGFWTSPTKGHPVLQWLTAAYGERTQ